MAWYTVKAFPKVKYLKYSAIGNHILLSPRSANPDPHLFMYSLNVQVIIDIKTQRIQARAINRTTRQIYITRRLQV